MNLIYLPHAKNQVRFEEKREKNVSGRQDGIRIRRSFPSIGAESGSGQGASGGRARERRQVRRGAVMRGRGRGQGRAGTSAGME